MNINKKNKAIMGRPKKPKSQKCSIRITLHVSQDDISVLPSLAKQTSTHLNAWTRNLVHQELDRLRDENTVSTDVNMG